MRVRISNRIGFTSRIELGVLEKCYFVFVICFVSLIVKRTYNRSSNLVAEVSPLNRVHPRSDGGAVHLSVAPPLIRRIRAGDRGLRGLSSDVCGELSAASRASGVVGYGKDVLEGSTLCAMLIALNGFIRSSASRSEKAERPRNASMEDLRRGLSGGDRVIGARRLCACSGEILDTSGLAGASRRRGGTGSWTIEDR